LEEQELRALNRRAAKKSLSPGRHEKRTSHRRVEESR
jgi:hypothetical protein